MKKLLILLAFVACAITVQAQNKVKIITKDGKTIVAELVKMDGMESATIKIAGVTTTIPMSNVTSIEEVTAEISTNATNATSEDEIGKDIKYKVTDTAEYPDSIIVDVNGEKIVMMLVRGGIMNMGYDGSGSRGCGSEPVHRVKLTSYYVSKHYMNKKFYESVLGNKLKTGAKDEIIKKSIKKTRQFCEILSQKTGKPFRLLSEAEWEYAAFLNKDHPFLKNRGYFNCLLEDNYGEYSNLFQIDPIYNNYSNTYVIRNDYIKKINERMSTSKLTVYFFRIAIKAKDWFGK